MQILGTTTVAEVVPRHNCERNKLEYVNMKIGQGTLLTMLDRYAIHNIIGEVTVRKVGLNFK